jgi:rhamnulokinase
MIERALKCVSKKEIYAATGTQFMQVNTVFQLLSMVESESPLLDRAETLLFMPDLFGFFLSGEKYSEYTIASTSQLLHAKRRIWESQIFEKLSLPLNIMAPIRLPGTVVGRLRTDVAPSAGLSSTDVIAPASHDTASAVVAVPATDLNWAYLSSGTWSLLGVELDEPIISDDTLTHNFTNEGGADQKIRFLRNTMGLWLLQRCMDVWKSEGKGLTFEELANRAVEATPFKCVIDSDDPLFLNPRDMTTAIAEFCRRTRQSTPVTLGEYVRSILESLALKYRFIIDTINAIRGKSIEVLHVVGGGSQNELLNQWTANATGLPVVAGPTEATAIGNILVQAIAKRELTGIEEARRLVGRSFPMKRYEPADQEAWGLAYEERKELFS